MAVKTYLQTAISEVQAAMSDMEQQMAGMRQDADNQKRDLQNKISNMEKERGLHMTAIGRLESNGERDMLQQRVSNLNQEMDHAKAQMAQIDNDLAQIQRRKDELHKNLYNAVGELTRLSALPDIG